MWNRNHVHHHSYEKPMKRDQITLFLKNLNLLESTKIEQF